MQNTTAIKTTLFIAAKKLIGYVSPSERGIESFSEEYVESQLPDIQKEIEKKYWDIKTKNNLLCANYHDTSSIKDKEDRFMIENKSLGETFFALKAWLEMCQLIEIFSSKLDQVGS